VNWHAVSSDVVRGNLRSLSVDGNVMPKHVGATNKINKLKEKLVYLLVFHAYMNEMHGSRSKISSKKFCLTALRGGI
jgi:hypothetical protein